MKRIGFLLFLLVCGLAQSDDDLSREEQANRAVLAWQHGFYRHLLAQQDPELQAYGIFLFHPYSNEPPADELAKLLSEHLHTLVQRQDLNLHTMWLISDLCRSDKVYPDCDINRLTDQMIQQHGEDLLPYLQPLHEAMQAGVEGEVFDWINRMAEASNHHLIMDNSSVFVQALEQYAAEHPLPTEYLYEHLGVGVFVQLDEFSDHELTYLNDHANEHMLLVLKINFSLIMPMPAFKGVLDACKTHPELMAACLSIGRLLSSDEGQYLSTVVGYKIQSEALRLAGQDDAARDAERRYQAYKEEMNCLNKLFTHPIIGKMDLDFMRMNMKIKREQGERAALIHSARHFHQQDLAAGVDPTQLTSPEACLAGSAKLK